MVPASALVMEMAAVAVAAAAVVVCVSLQPAASPAGSLTGGGLRRSCARIV